MNKKAQGISLNYIVIAAIAVLVLVVVVAFATGGLGKSFGQLESAGPGEDAIFKSSCTSACELAKAVTTSAGWNSSEYCTDTDSSGNKCAAKGITCTHDSGFTCP